LLRLSARLAPLVALVALGRGMRRAQVLHLGVSVSGSAVLGFIAVQFRL